MRRLLAPLACVLLLGAAPRVRAAEPAPEPPLNISADNMSGSHGPEGDFVMLSGNVRIRRGRVVLTSDEGRYFNAQGMLYLDGRVRMVDSLTTLTCEHASYSEDHDVLFVQGNVTLVDKESTLKAPSGTYDRRSGRADLAGPVDGRDRDLHLLAERAIYMRDSAVVQARGNVHGVDEKNKTELDAHAVDYDRVTKIAVATGDPVLRSKDDDGHVTELRAILLIVDTQKKIAEAVDSVRVVRDTLQARGDRALFDDLAQRGWVTGHPRVWDDQTVVTGDTLEFATDRRAIRKVIVRPDAVMDYAGSRVGTLGEASRLTGDTVTVYFTSNDIDSLVAVGKARNTYTGVPRAGKTSERNEAAGDSITVFFKQRKIDRARVEGKAHGTYFIAVDEGDTTAAAKERVAYDAKRIEFRVPQSLIVLDREAHLVYQDLELRSRRVQYDIDRQTLEAEGSPVLGDRGEVVKGGLMTYELESRVGTIYDAQTNYEKGLYVGDRIRKVGDNELHVLSGSYTTCPSPEPHFHFAAHWMKIYLKDKLVAKPVVFYIKNVPLLALPFWVFPVKPGRHSGFLFPQFEFGLNNRAGQFIRNAGYYWAMNDYMDLTVAGDYYQQQPAWLLRADGQYKLLYVLDGNFSGSFRRSEDPANRRDDWDFNAQHMQDVTSHTKLTANAQFTSSKSYNSSDGYGKPLSQRLNRFLTSSLAVSHNARWANFNIVMDRRQDLDAEQDFRDQCDASSTPFAVGRQATLPSLTGYSPNVSINFTGRTIGDLGPLKKTFLAQPLKSVYFSLSSRFVTYSERRAYVAGYAPADTSGDSTAVLGEAIHTRRGLTNNIGLSDSRKLFGWINFQPSLRANVVVFDHDVLGHKVVPAAVWSSGLTMSSTFYGTFRPGIFGVEGLRHIVSPSVSLSYSPDFPGLSYTNPYGITLSRFTSFGGIGISGARQSYLSFGLDQRFQAKVKRKGDIVRLDNMLSWSMAGSYDFLYRERGAAHPLSNISSSVLVQPPSYMNASLYWVTDVYNPKPVRALTYNLGLNLTSGGLKRATPDLPLEKRDESETEENWTLGFAYSYAGGYQSSASGWSSAKTANVVAHYQLTSAWSLDYSASLDLSMRSVQTQRFVLMRDLHCWQASFTRMFVVGGEAEYFFRIGVKDQKEIYFERGTRMGSLGGIQ